MKKSFLFFILMLLPMLASADAVEVDGIYYNLIPKGNAAEVTANPYSYSGDIIIPEQFLYDDINYTVTSIGGHAFENCNSLTSITIPNSIKSIGEYAFYKCAVSAVKVYDLTAWCNIDFKGFAASPLQYAHRLYVNDEEIVDLVIPSNVTTINKDAFKGCTSITSVTFPNNVTSIGYESFYGCTNLTSATIGDNNNNVASTIIGFRAFSRCIGLESVTIGNNVKQIERNAFEYCTILASITIPNSVNSIGSHVFMGCTNLSFVELPENISSIEWATFAGCTSIESITIPNTVETIEEGAFSGCTNLTSIILPKNLSSIGPIAFEYCSGLTSITIPDKVTTIEQGTFYDCKSLTDITLGRGVTELCCGSFANCTQISNVYCYAEKIPTCNVGCASYYGRAIGAFEDSYIEYATLHVPNGKLDVYKTIEPWKNFNIIGDIVNAKVKLSKSKATIEKGKTLTLKATITPSDLSDKSVTWTSSNTKVATVTSAGKVKGVKTGTATITCTSNSTGAKATCKVTVGSVKLDKTEATILKGKTTTLTATVYPSSLKDKSVTWESSNTKIATVTSAGKVKGVKVGTATITCTSNATGLKATCTVNVVKGFVNLNKTEACVQKGKTVTLKATVTPETLADKSVTWESSDTKIATVTSAGKVKGVKYGTATITCTSVATGAKATCQVTVGKVVISMSEFSLKRSRTNMLTATVYPSDLTDKSVTWESSDPSIATVTAEGKVKGIKAGTATITCTSVATGLKGTCTVTVLSNSEARSMIGDDDELTGLKELESPAVVEPFDVYDLSGRKVLHQVTSLDGLPDGIYIVNGKKILKKK